MGGLDGERSREQLAHGSPGTAGASGKVMCDGKAGEEYLKRRRDSCETWDVRPPDVSSGSAKYSGWFYGGPYC